MTRLSPPDSFTNPGASLYIVGRPSIGLTPDGEFSRDMASPVPSSSERIGDLLLKEGLISKEQLEKALQEQRQYGTRVGYNLVKLGFIP